MLQEESDNEKLEDDEENKPLIALKRNGFKKIRWLRSRDEVDALLPKKNVTPSNRRNRSVITKRKQEASGQEPKQKKAKPAVTGGIKPEKETPRSNDPLILAKDLFDLLKNQGKQQGKNFNPSPTVRLLMTMVADLTNKTRMVQITDQTNLLPTQQSVNIDTSFLTLVAERLVSSGNTQKKIGKIKELVESMENDQDSDDC